MRLYTESEVNPDGSGLLCRQSRLRGTFGTALFGGLFAAIPYLWWRLGAPWPVWGGCALLALVIGPLLIRDMLQRLRSSNWVLWIRPDGLWIKFRSYHDRHAPDDAPAVAHVEYSEVAQVRPLVESYSTPTGHGSRSVRHREQALLIHLNDPDGGMLQQALAAERTRQPAERGQPGFHFAQKARHFAVTMPSPAVIRIAWRGGHGNDVTPSVESALDCIARFTSIQTAVTTDFDRRERPSWDKLDDSQLNELIRHLVESGATIDASRLLVRRKGYTTTEAHNWVEEVARQADRLPQT